MITLVDSNILIDIFGADAKFGSASAKALKKCMDEGAVHACEIVWVEVGVLFPNQQAFMGAMETLNIEFSAINQLTVNEAVKAWQLYRKAEGKRERVVADFLIGAHALTQGNRLLTRDKGFHRHYFAGLNILDPTSKSVREILAKPEPLDESFPDIEDPSIQDENTL